MGVVPAPVGFSRLGPKVTTSPKIKKGVSPSDLRQISLVVSLPALCLLWPYMGSWTAWGVPATMGVGGDEADV